MMQIQTNLKNFSVFEDVFSFFSGLKLDYNILIENGIVRADRENCPRCKSKLSLNGYNSCTDKHAKQFGLSLKKGKLVCSNPCCTFSYNVKKEVFESWFSQFEEYVETIILSLKKKKLSPKKIAEHIYETMNHSFSEDYISDKIKKIIDSMQKPIPRETHSGVIVHDEQFVTIKGKEMMRITVVDANNSNVYYDGLQGDRTEETIAHVCKKIKEDIKELLAVVLDGHVASRNAYLKEFFGILIQYCLFHFAMNVREAYKEEVGYGRGNACIPLNYLVGFFSIMNIFFDHDREIVALRNLQKELQEHITRINAAKYSLIEKQKYIDDYNKKYDFNARKYLHEVRKARRRTKGIQLVLRTEEQALQLLQKAKIENVFPKKVQKQINRLEKNWKNFTHCLRNNKIPPTSNKVEQYYGTTLNWVEKNNLQSEKQFYDEQKLFLSSRYKISIFRQGIFSGLLKKTFLLLGIFGRIS